MAHDAQGQRLRAMYSLAGKVVHEERLGKGASEYIYVGGRLLATRSSTGVTWTHVDALGSPVAVKKPRPWPGLFVWGGVAGQLTPHRRQPDATTAAGTSATTNPPHHPPR